MDSEVFARRESQVRSYCRRFDAVFDTASGSTVTDVAGRTYIDFLAAAGSLNYGHNDPDMVAALVEHLQRGGVLQTLDLHSTAKQRFLEVFERLVLEPRGMPHRVQFTGPTGTNAVEAALKLARKVTGRTNVIAFTNGFHGVSLGSLAATGNRHHRIGPVMPMGGVSRLPFDGYGDLDSTASADLLEAMLADPSSGLDAPAAVLLETTQCEGGLNVASDAWLRRVADITRRHGALLIVDDIQTGCGRSGSFFGFERAGVVPDLVTLSKSLSGLGLPMALLLSHPRHDTWQPGEHNGTFRGSTPAFVTATVALEKFWQDDRLIRDVQRRTSLLADGLEEMAQKVPGARVKGMAMMQGLDVRSGGVADRIARRCFEHGLIVETAGPHDEVLKLFPPLTTPDDLLQDGLAVLRRSIEESNVEFS